jgi:DNA-binding MarR family transcriptional regulator
VKRGELASTVVLLTRLSRSVFLLVDDDQLGMTFKQFTALCLIRDADGSGQKQIGKTLLLDSNALTVLINQLEDRGFVERTRDRRDRRRQIVTITDSGRSALAHSEKQIDAAAGGVFDRLTTAQRTELRDLLAAALGDDAAADTVTVSARLGSDED